jgi:hypothetical protein
MSKNVLTNVRIFAGAVDLTGSSNKSELSTDVEDKDVTTFASNGWNEVVGGLAKAEWKASGYWEAGDDTKVDNHTWATLGANIALTHGPVNANVGSVAYLMKAMRGSYTLLGEVGDVAPWEANGMSNWPLVRGVFAHPPGTPRTSTGTGTVVEYIAVPAGKRLYASLHVLAASGSSPTLDVTVESDVDEDFEDPTTVLTFTQATGRTSEILRTNGDAVTDTFYRVTYTIDGTTPSFTFVAALGVA